MKEFLKNNWQRIICVLAAIVTIVFCFFRPLQFKCGAETYIENRKASDWGISKNSTASKYFDATNFTKFDEYLVNTLKIPAYSYGNFKYNLDIVIQLAIKGDMYNDFIADWQKVEAGTLDRRKVVTFGTFDTDLLVHKVEYLGTEAYTDACLVYPISNNQERHYFGNYKVLNFKVTFNFGQSYNSQYRDVVLKEYEEISIVYQLEGCTGSTNNPTTIYQNSRDVPLSFSLQDGYTWEGADIQVNGLTYTWNDGFMFVNPLQNITATRIGIYAKEVVPESYTLESGTYKWIDSPVLPSDSLDFSYSDIEFCYLVSNNVYNTDFSVVDAFIVDSEMISYGDPAEGIYNNYEPNIGWYTRHASLGVDYTVTDTDKLRTIILSSDIEVSADFYNWAITGGNLVKQEGETWVLNEILNNTTISGDNGAPFTSNGSNYLYFNRVYDKEDDYDWLVYHFGDGSSTSVVYYGYNDGGPRWANSAYRTITFLEPVTDSVLLAWLQANGTKQTTQTLQSDSPVLLAESNTTIVSVIRDSPYNITIAPEFPTLKTKFFDSWNDREFGYRITRADISFSGASRPQWVKPASGTPPTAYHVVLANIMEYLAYYGYTKNSVEGELYFTSYFSSGSTRYYYGESAPIGYNHSNFFDQFIRIDAFDGAEKSFFIDGFSIHLVGNGKDSYGDYSIAGSTAGKEYQLFNYYRESDPENSCDYPYSFEYYPLVSDNFGVSIGAGTGDIQGYDYNQFYMPLDDFNFFDLFKGATWYAILNNSIVWLCCELPLLSNLTRPLYTAARLTSNYLVQYIIPFFSATGIIGAAAGFVILISVIWRWIKGND